MFRSSAFPLFSALFATRPRPPPPLGRYQVKPALPFTLGTEYAGEVVAAGAKVKNLSIGDRVCGYASFGAFTQYLTVSSRKAGTAIPIPDSMSHDEAAGFLTANGTAWYAVMHRAQLRPGQTILVHATAGGVGIAAVQIAKAQGANVIATVGSDDKFAVVRSAGADRVINYNSNQNWPASVLELTKKRGADVIFDPVGGDIFNGSLKCVRMGGQVLIVGYAGGRIPTLATNRLLLKNCNLVGIDFGSFMKAQVEVAFEFIMQLIDLHAQKKFKIFVYKPFAFNELP